VDPKIFAFKDGQKSPILKKGRCKLLGIYYIYRNGGFVAILKGNTDLFFWNIAFKSKRKKKKKKVVRQNGSCVTNLKKTCLSEMPFQNVDFEGSKKNIRSRLDEIAKW